MLKKSALALLAVLTAACASSKAYRAPDFQQRIKTVAVVSVTGPERMVGTKKELAQQAAYDLAEEKLIAALASKGLTVVPVKTGGDYVAKNYDTAFLRSLSAEQQKTYGAGKEAAAKLKERTAEVEKAAYGVEPGAKVVASKQTAYVVDYLSPGMQNGQPAYSEPFRKGLGLLAKSLKADAVLVVRVVPSVVYPPLHVPGTGGESIKTVMHVAAFDAEGVAVFTDVVDWAGSESVRVNGMAVPLSEEKMNSLARKGVENNVEDVVEHLTAAK